jgi:hypothetical protein
MNRRKAERESVMYFKSRIGYPSQLAAGCKPLLQADSQGSYLLFLGDIYVKL